MTNLSQWIVLLVVAGVCGSVGSGLAGHRHTGCLGSIALGFIGGLVGSWLSRLLHLPEMFSVQLGHERFPIVWSIVGAALFVSVVCFLTRPSRF
jgi:uncharacterized membrane protein YeaQ/YmgE (transglycosylase-associated protein family)